MSAGQLELGVVEEPEWRVRVLAEVVAGFLYPGRGSFEKLTKPQKESCLAAARAALALRIPG